MFLVLLSFNIDKHNGLLYWETLLSLFSTFIPCYQVHAVLEEILEKLPEEFNMAELLGKAEERTPYQVVALQECERMNILTQEIRYSLHELSLGLKVSSGFEELMGGCALL